MKKYSPLRFSFAFASILLLASSCRKDSAVTPPPQQTSISLDQNSPNPFNPSTEISYTLLGSESKDVTLTIFDALGRVVRTLASGEHTPGRYTRVFNAADLQSGIYFCILRCDEKVISKRMTLVK